MRKLKITNLSQTDKRATYAKNIASFVLKHKCSPVELIEAYHNDIYELRKALINCKSAGGMATKQICSLEIWLCSVFGKMSMVLTKLMWQVILIP